MKDSLKKQIGEYVKYISDCKYIEKCSYFINIALNYIDSLSNYDGNNLIAINSVYFPEIFIRACGGIPVYILGGWEGVLGEVDEIFPQVSDSVVKSQMNLLFDEEMPFKNKLRAIVVSIDNDSNRKQAYYLERKGYKTIKKERIQFVLDSTKDYFKREENYFVSNLMKLMRRPITKKSLIESAKKITKSHNLFREIDKSILQSKLKIFLKESYYLTQDIDKWQEEIELLLKELPKDKEKENSLLIVGSDIQFPNYKLNLILEETGITDYINECSVPYPYDYSELDEKDSFITLFRKIHDIHYRNEHFSSTLGCNDMIFNKNTNAVLFHLLKGQLSSAYYANKVEKFCIDNNIPFLCVETDYTKADKEQIKIRIEAFTELLKVRNKSKNRSIKDYEREMA